MTFSASGEQKYFSLSLFFFTQDYVCFLKKKIVSLTCRTFEFVGKCLLGMLHGPVGLQWTKLNVQYLFFTGSLFYDCEAQPHFDPFAPATSLHLSRIHYR